jgi:hypothetical protein
MGLWEFASHIRAITVIGTTVQLVAPTEPTERGASDPMGLRSSAGHISGNSSGFRAANRHRPSAAVQITWTGFAPDSPLEEAGFELLVPLPSRTLRRTVQAGVNA